MSQCRFCGAVIYKNDFCEDCIVNAPKYGYDLEYAIHYYSLIALYSDSKDEKMEACNKISKYCERLGILHYHNIYKVSKDPLLIEREFSIIKKSLSDRGDQTVPTPKQTPMMKTSPEKASKHKTVFNEFVAVDLETTGFSATRDSIIEIGALHINETKIVDSYSTLVNSVKRIPAVITRITGIDASMLKNAPSPEQALEGFVDFVADKPLVAHNASFDIGFLETAIRRHIGKAFRNQYACTMRLSRRCFPELANHKLETICKELDITNSNHHRALSDSYCSAEIYLKCIYGKDAKLC